MNETHRYMMPGSNLKIHPAVRPALIKSLLCQLAMRNKSTIMRNCKVWFVFIINTSWQIFISLLRGDNVTEQLRHCVKISFSIFVHM